MARSIAGIDFGGLVLCLIEVHHGRFSASVRKKRTGACRGEAFGRLA
ncbi:MAG: hypothetical protein AB1589_35115 [Cyanobacteriota bacterium]